MWQKGLAVTKLLLTLAAMRCTVTMNNKALVLKIGMDMQQDNATFNIVLNLRASENITIKINMVDADFETFAFENYWLYSIIYNNLLWIYLS